MVKYWNERWVRAERERRRRERDLDARRGIKVSLPGYELGTNAALDDEAMLDALGAPIRRKMIKRLQTGGAMSVTKLSLTFDITLAATMKHLRSLERAGIVTTHKQGRVRFCVYNPTALRHLARHLESRYFTKK